MIKSTEPKRFPAWLRGVGWLAFGILVVVTVLVTARWLLLNSGHQAANMIVSAQRKKPAPQVHLAPSSDAVPVAMAGGIPLASIPHFGSILVGDKETWLEFSKKLDEITPFLRYRIDPKKADGGGLFRGILQNMGIEVADTMTEAEAAAEYLKQADRFSTLLAQWREAVATGPLEKAADYKSDPTIWRFSSLYSSISRLLAMTAQARLQTGDTAGAWADWQAIHNYDTRLAEFYPTERGYDGSLVGGALGVARSGIRSGAWTDDQLAEISSLVARKSVLADALRNQEVQKKYITDYYMNFHEHEEEFGQNFLKTPSRFDQMVNQVKLKLITDQQIRDNMDVRLAELDKQLSHFDLETGFYVRPTDEELRKSGRTEDPPGMLGSFYFMINDMYGWDPDDQRTARWVIQTQSDFDQTRLAAALETYRHHTGNYPDHLEAVSGQFPNGAPLDIATGQPYLYQRNADGGYTLWGTGIDGKSEGGHEKTDVTWTQRPVKGK